MSARYVTLGCGRRVSLASYVAAWKRTIALLPDTRVFGSPHESRAPVTAAEARRQFRAGLHDRINRHDPRFGVGRKWDSDWQRAVRYTATLLQVPRVSLDWLPPDLRNQLSHRLRSHVDA
jgi:hypothetical protein